MQWKRPGGGVGEGRVVRSSPAPSCTPSLHFQQVVSQGRPELVQTLPGRARTETHFVPLALQLAGALDLPAGSCAFEENTCGFDSAFAFQPWILNEEGKETQCPGAQVNLLPAGWLFHGGNASWS